MTPQETIARVDELRRERGPDWPAAWLAERGLAEWLPDYQRFQREGGTGHAQDRTDEARARF
jgi:hypothetical protein